MNHKSLTAMSNELSYKHQVILKGGQYDDSDDTVEGWLNFLTDPNNLQPGLPNLTVAVGEWLIYFIHVSFDKTKSSLSSIKLELNSYDDSEISIFRDPNPPDAIPSNTTGASNPHHLRNWVFGLFEQPELESLEIPFLTPELPNLFDRLPKLKYVSLNKSRLVRLPPGFYKLPALRTLDIVGALFPELPAAIASLPALQHLSFDQPFTPSVLASLTRLTNLQCHCRDLQVPPELGQLKNLESLHLASIVSAPDNLLNFPNLKWLNLTVSKFTKFRFGNSSLPALQELVTNNIEVFCTALAGFKNLQKISASGSIYPSDMEPLKTSFARLDKLTRLSLNRLQYFNVEKGLFYGRTNELEFFSSLPSLEYLNLNENGLRTMPQLSNLKDLKELHLRKNWFSEFKELPANLEYIDLGKNDFISFSTDLSYLKELKTFLLNNNKIVGFGVLPPNLEHLDLSENRIVEIPSGLHYLLNLKTLGLNGNQLTAVPHLPANLTTVDLSKNAITLLPLGLNKLQKLKVLKLNHNPITDFPELLAMPGLERLETVDTKLPETEHSVTPTEEVLEKLKKIFPNATLCFYGFELK
jgi:Leucine-rich repeat (LRR) protein